MFAADMLPTDVSASSPPSLLTVVIPVLDEADRLPACLASVAWAAEVIVVDGGSTDGTRELARAAGARVLECRGRTIGEQKNVGIAAARHRWILSLDADERVSPELRASIEQVVRTTAPKAYELRLRNRYLGVPFMYGSWGRDRHVRLFPNACRWSHHQVHEKLVGAGDVGVLTGFLDHDSYRDLPHQLRKSVTYATWGAADLLARDARVSFAMLLVRPLWRFVKTFLLQGMWREGTRGLIFCVVHAWSCFAKYAVLWDLQRRARVPTSSDPAVAAAALPTRRAAAPVTHATAPVSLR